MNTDISYARMSVLSPIKYRLVCRNDEGSSERHLCASIIKFTLASVVDR